MRFRPAHQSLINRRLNDRAPCHARQSPEKMLARKPRFHSPASWNGGHESGASHEIRFGDQSQDREGIGALLSDAAHQRRRGDRIGLLSSVNGSLRAKTLIATTQAFLCKLAPSVGTSASADILVASGASSGSPQTRGAGSLAGCYYVAALPDEDSAARAAPARASPGRMPKRR